MSVNKVKYHVSDNGEVVECKATIKECPKQNFNTISEAENYQKELFSQHTSFHTSKRKKPLPVLEQAKKKYGDNVEPYSIKVPNNAKGILHELEVIGNPLIVGGYVRDSLVGKESKDLDIEVYGATLDEISQHMREKDYHVNEVGKQFGVLKIRKNNAGKGKAKRGTEFIDVSVPRKENKLAKGHRSFGVDVDENMSVEEAVKRRDFTFNAIMYDRSRGVIVDLAGGKKDFENKVMRHVSEKFADDPLRVLRGFQFAGRFEMTLAPETASLCQSIRNEYSDLSEERVREEWNKFFEKSSKPSLGIKALQDSQWDDLSPGLKEVLQDSTVSDSLDSVASNITDKRDKRIFGAAVIAEKMKNDYRQEFLKYGSINDKERSLINAIIDADNYDVSSSYGRKNAAFELHKKGLSLKNYSDFCSVRGLYSKVEEVSLSKEDGVFDSYEASFVSGNDLIILFPERKPGSWIKDALDNVRGKQYTGELLSKNEALAYLKEFSS